MQDIKLPFLSLPTEFTALLKANLSTVTTPSPVFDVLRPNRALMAVMERAFSDLDDGRGLEKTMVALGWHNFRNRLASLYVFKALYGKWPLKTDPTLVEDILAFETKFSGAGLQSHSRLFLLGLYLKLSRIQQDFPAEEMLPVLRLSQGRVEKADWLILVTWHFLTELGAVFLTDALSKGKTFNDLYELLPEEFRRRMTDNLLAYSGSIHEADQFLYEKV